MQEAQGHKAWYWGGQSGDIMVWVPVAEDADLVVIFGMNLVWEGGGNGHRQLQNKGGGVEWKVLGVRKIFLCCGSLWESHEA